MATPADRLGLKQPGVGALQMTGLEASLPFADVEVLYHFSTGQHLCQKPSLSGFSER
jgi:hypothetical protein